MELLVGRPATRVGVLGLLAAGLLAAAAGAARAAEWDQAAAGKLAAELATACQALYDRSYQDPTSLATTGFGAMGNAQYQYMDRVRLLRQESVHLRDQLAKGAGLAATLPVYKRLREIDDDVQMYSGQFMMLADASQELAAVQGLVEKLGTYYAPHRN